jgi:hypothetical protein
MPMGWNNADSLVRVLPLNNIVLAFPSKRHGPEPVEFRPMLHLLQGLVAFRDILV